MKEAKKHSIYKQQGKEKYTNVDGKEKYCKERMIRQGEVNEKEGKKNVKAY